MSKLNKVDYVVGASLDGLVICEHIVDAEDNSSKHSVKEQESRHETRSNKISPHNQGKRNCGNAQKDVRAKHASVSPLKRK